MRLLKEFTISVSYWILRAVSGPIIKSLFIKRVSGLQNIPQEGPAILAFNHQSLFDFICFAAISPRNVHFLAAEKFFQHKYWKILMTITGQIRVNRDVHIKNETHDLVEYHVNKGDLIGIFPEGTRSPHEMHMLKAFTGVASFSLKHRVPIIPVGIIGTYHVMAIHEHRPRFKKIVQIHVGEVMHFKEHHGKDSDKSICSLVTEQVMKAIERLSGKKYLHYEFLK